MGSGSSTQQVDAVESALAGDGAEGTVLSDEEANEVYLAVQEKFKAEVAALAAAKGGSIDEAALVAQMMAIGTAPGGEPAETTAESAGEAAAESAGEAAAEQA